MEIIKELWWRGQKEGQLTLFQGSGRLSGEDDPTETFLFIVMLDQSD